MDVYYLDTSAAVKRYIVEVGSSWITSLTDPAAGNTCWLSAVTRVETLAAFYLRLRTGTLTPTQVQQAELVFRSELSTHYQLLPVRAGVLARAMSLVAVHPLRAYDAIQLAAALLVQAQYTSAGVRITFLSADRRLVQAAAAEGLAVDNPNNHP